MPIVALSAIIPLKAPRQLGRDRNVLPRLWDAADDCVSLIRAVFSGRVVEVHEEEPVDGVTTITHNLKRRPYGLIVLRNSADTRKHVDLYDRWTETEIVISSSTVTLLTFVLF